MMVKSENSASSSSSSSKNFEENSLQGNLDNEFLHDMIASNEKIKLLTQEENLGSGSFGTVFKVTHKISGKHFAVKACCRRNGEEGISPSICREIFALMQLRDHANVVHFYDNILRDNGALLVLELVDQNLKEVVKKVDGPLPLEYIKSFMKQIASGLDHAHMRAICHRDLKPQNILVSNSGWVKLTDFGLAIPIDEDTDLELKNIVRVSTLRYRAPEILMGYQNYTKAVDIWSLGCIFAELLTHKTFFRGVNAHSQLEHIFRKMGSPTTETWPEYTQLPNFKKYSFPTFIVPDLAASMSGIENSGLVLLTSMLQYTYEKRIPACQVIRHTFLRDGYHPLEIYNPRPLAPLHTLFKEAN